MSNDVTVRNVAFKYDKSESFIFNDVNMEVPAGQFVCILGKSGCGKSTLLRLLAGLEKPTRGEIVIGEKPVKGASLNQGVVFQDYGLYPWMTAGRNIEIALEQKYPEWTKEERTKLTKKVIKEVGLNEQVYKMLPKELSGGMQQRCAIARAFALDPPVLLMDEPFGALDAVTRVKLQDMLLDLWDKSVDSKTIFFVTHDVDEALFLANKIYVLGQGGNDIIFECEVSSKNRATRSSKESEETVNLRNELVYQINRDVSLKATQEELKVKSEERMD